MQAKKVRVSTRSRTTLQFVLRNMGHAQCGTYLHQPANECQGAQGRRAGVEHLADFLEHLRPYKTCCQSMLPSKQVPHLLRLGK